MSEKLREAAQALLDKLYASREAMYSVCWMSEIHGAPYNGPTIGVEMEALRAALSEEAPAADAQELDALLFEFGSICKFQEWDKAADLIRKIKAVASRPLPALEAQAGRQDAASASEQPVDTGLLVATNRDGKYMAVNILGDAKQVERIDEAQFVDGSGADPADIAELSAQGYTLHRVMLARLSATALSEQDQPADQSQAKQAEYPPLPDAEAYIVTLPVDVGVGMDSEDVLRWEPGLEDEPSEALFTADQMRAYVDADRAARAGFVLVPVEPTEEMVERICEVHAGSDVVWPRDFGSEGQAIRRGKASAGYKAALAARPRGAGD